VAKPSGPPGPTRARPRASQPRRGSATRSSPPRSAPAARGARQTRSAPATRSAPVTRSRPTVSRARPSATRAPPPDKWCAAGEVQAHDAVGSGETARLRKPVRNPHRGVGDTGVEGFLSDFRTRERIAPRRPPRGHRSAPRPQPTG
jgi:hypothetical protein